MHTTDHKVSARRFFALADLIKRAFAGPMPTPDYLAHECELAEQALSRAIAKTGSTADPALAKLFALTHKPAEPVVSTAKDPNERL